MTIAYFDCFGGISGDMALGALVDAGADPSVLEAAVEALGLRGEVSVSCGREQRGHLGGTRVNVDVGGGRSRSYRDLEAALEIAEGLPARVRSLSLDALSRLGRAESGLHGEPLESLHLHELSGADTLVDLAGAYWLLESLGVERVYASPLPAPRGQSGEMPLPPPASLRVLAGTGAVLEPSDAGREQVTPTGAAILAAAAEFRRPGLQLAAVGYGFGSHPAADNALAVWLGEYAGAAGEVDVLETNLDDMAPNDLAALADDLMSGGALDVTTTPVVMKKGRAGHALSVICDPASTAAMTQLLLIRSSSLGLRVTRTPRVIAAREMISVSIPAGEVRVKVKRIGAHLEVAAEHDDLRRLQAAGGGDIGELRHQAEVAARARLGGS